MRNSKLVNVKQLNVSRQLCSRFSTEQKVNDTFWLPFTNNRNFQANPKLIEKAEGVYYYLYNKQKVLDATSGLW